MYTVYWIKKPSHKNPFKEGYVGITNNLNRRLDDHRCKPKNPILRNVINKHSWEGLEVVTLLDDLEKDLALSIEKTLRPKNRIGWNINPGGGMPPVPVHGRKGKPTFHIEMTNYMDNRYILIGSKDIKALNLDESHVYACVRGERKSHRGYTFKKVPIINYPF